jgi:hypothetical protein
MPALTQVQRDIIDRAFNSRAAIHGPAGCGKTTVAVQRMQQLLGRGLPAESILVLTPQRTLGEPYHEALRSTNPAPGGEVTLATVGGLARRMADLFWPLAAGPAGFTHPDQPPVFLTLETAQYYMAHLVRPLLDEGYFESVTIDRNRLYSQILDNLNKSAAVGFSPQQIAERLTAALNPNDRELAAKRRVYTDAQDCALRFRQYCLDHNLLDFSLQLEIFRDILWPDPTVRGYLTRLYRCLIYDNVEEDVPVAHDLIRDWLPDLDSALLVYDEGGGYRRFLGADPGTAHALRELCAEDTLLDESFVVSEEIEHLARSLSDVIAPDFDLSPPRVMHGEEQEGTSLEILTARFYPEMLDAVADETRRLIDEGAHPSEIAILAPYLSDALRFSLMERLHEREIPVRSHRPSRSLSDEPAAQCLLTLAALAHPAWEIRPAKYDVAHALMQALDSLDLVRAQLLTDIVYRAPRSGRPTLSTFEQIKPDVQERITFVFGQRYETLRTWLEAYRSGDPIALDHFLRKLFGEVLSQPGFGFNRNFDAARVAASLIESIQKFRLVAEENLAAEGIPLGLEYVHMLQDGVIAAQYLEAWRVESEESVLVAPAYTFLMMNHPVDVQFWLDPGSGGWTERVYQPLTHPYVLSREWLPGRPWLDSDEVAAAQLTLARLVNGLLRRCRRKVYLGLSELGEQGYEQRGALLKSFQRILTQEGK